MRRRVHNMTCCCLLLAVGAGMFGHVAARAAEDQPLDLPAIESRLAAVEELVRTDLAQEAAWKEARQELFDLLPTSERLFKAAGGENDPRTPVFKTHSKLLGLLAAINARLPAEQSIVGYRLSPLPVPRYEPQTVIGTAAEQLWTAQQKLIQQVRGGGEDSAEFHDLLAEMILAEEKLAYEMGWPYTAAEATAVARAGRLTGDAYLSRRGRGVERINADLQRHLAGAGREAVVPQFAIHSPPLVDQQQEVERRIVERRGEAGKVWIKGTQPFDKQVILAPASRRD